MKRLGMLVAAGGVLAYFALAASSALGAQWSVQLTPSSGAISELGGVACVKPTLCTAVGDHGDQLGPRHPSAERWDGVKWTTQVVPVPDGSVFSGLGSIACPSARSCIAGGDWSTASVQHVLGEKLIGSSWGVLPAPDPGPFASVASIACATEGACLTVGNYTAAGKTAPFSEQLTGTSWNVQNLPTPSGATLAGIGAVSCPTASWCMAVGNYLPSPQQAFTWAAMWTGGTWSVLSTPSPGTTMNQMHSISCTSSTACTAVGDYLDAAGFDTPFALRWDGTSWSVQSIPPPSASTSELLGVSCTTSTSCTAGGDYVDSTGTFLTLAEHWDGTSWSIQPTPNPPEAQQSRIRGIACTGPQSCEMVGYWVDGQGHFHTLALGTSQTSG
jgi:hypothetical protein